MVGRMLRPTALPPRPSLRARMARRAARLTLALALPLVGVALLLDEASTGAPPAGDAVPVATVGAAEPRGEVDVAAPAARDRDTRTVARGVRPDPPRERTVMITLRGASAEWVTSQARVSDALAEVGLDVGEDDEVTPGLDEPVRHGMEIVLQRVDLVEVVTREAQPAEVIERRTDDRLEGERVVVREGRDGWHETVQELRVVDGVERDRAVVGEATEEPVDRIVEIGTAPEPDPDPAPEPGPAPAPGPGPEPEPDPDPGSGSAPAGGTASEVWDQLAQCEAGGDWTADTGNGYYGGLQFHPDTWAAHGGRQYAEQAHQASRAEQIAVAERVRDAQGWSAWPHCSRELGLR